MGRLITHSTPRLLRLSSLVPLFFVLIFKCMELHNLRIVEASECHILGTGALHHSRVSRGIWVVPWKAPLSPRQGFLVLREIALLEKSLASRCCWQRAGAALNRCLPRTDALHN